MLEYFRINDSNVECNLNNHYCWHFNRKFHIDKWLCSRLSYESREVEKWRNCDQFFYSVNYIQFNPFHIVAFFVHFTIYIESIYSVFIFFDDFMHCVWMWFSIVRLKFNQQQFRKISMSSNANKWTQSEATKRKQPSKSKP